MAYRRVRIYDGLVPGTNVIGMSAGATELADHPDFSRFLERAGYQWREINERPEGSVSYRHIEVSPPLDMAATIELGAVSVGGTIEIAGGGTIRYEGAIDGGDDGILVIENRTTIPEGMLGSGDYIIARGT